MSEWWTYTLSDFLLFSPRTYYRLLELYNTAIFPAQLVALALGVAVLVVLGRASDSGRFVASVLAGAWAWVAWAFHWTHYSTINWAATYFAAAFGVEAALLLWLGVLRGTLHFTAGGSMAARIGVGLYACALIVEPLIGPLVGRAWRQTEVFGVMPDPTVVGTLGLLLIVRSRIAWALLPIPLAWCALGGALEWAMESPDALLLPLAGVLVLLLAATRKGSGGDS